MYEKFLEEGDDDDDAPKNKTKKVEKINLNEVTKDSRCHTQAYNLADSTSGYSLKNESTKVAYGSAKLTGFLWKDYTCLKPLDLDSM